MKHCTVNKIKLKAPAKINLFLEVTGKRPDGFHDLATLFARISLADELTLEKTARPGIKLRVVNRANLEPLAAGDNIVHKAATAFFEAFGLEPAVEIKLVKKVPVGAGLGGGSSDAAAALKGLCRLYGVRPERNRAKLNAIALSLGSDVPFFLSGGGLAVGAGRGEVLKAVKTKERLPRIVLIYPGTPVYTGPVYKALKLPSRGEVSRNLKKLAALVNALKAGKPLKDWAELLFNRLEEPVLPVHTKVRRVRELLVGTGAPAVLMSGSGAVVFALAESRVDAGQIAKILKKRGFLVFLTDFLLKS